MLCNLYLVVFRSLNDVTPTGLVDCRAKQGCVNLDSLSNNLDLCGLYTLERENLSATKNHSYSQQLKTPKNKIRFL